MNDRQTVTGPNGRFWPPVCVSLALLALLFAGLAAALGPASCLLYASLRLNPLHAGYAAWLNTALAWYDARLPNLGRRLAGSALFGILIAFGGPGLGVYALWDRSARRRLYGDARFANDADIRRAGL